MSSISTSAAAAAAPAYTHPLNGKWDLYYHLPHDTNWELSSYRSILADINTAEQVVGLNESAISEYVVQNSMLFLMRRGITPMWEDAKNRDGGCFSFRIPNKYVHDIWKTLIYSVCGETLFADRVHNEAMNGVTVSPKRNFCIVKVWMRNCENIDPNTISNVPNLSKQGCLFKKHEPEF
jgi:hypothetical protein